MGLRENLSDFWTITKYNLKIEMRYPISYVASMLNLLFWLLAFATLVLLFSGNGSAIIQINMVAWGLATYDLFNMFTGEVGFGMIRLQRRGTLEQILLTPVSIAILPLGLAGYSLIISLLFILANVAILLYLTSSPIIIGDPLGGLVAFILLLLMFYGFALALAGLSIKLKRSSWALVNTLQFVFMIFCGAFYSFSRIPGIIRSIAMLIPFSYGVDLFRTTLIGVKPELIVSDISLGAVVLSPSQAEWLLVSVLAIIFLLVGYIILMKTIESGKQEGYLGTF